MRGKIAKKLRKYSKRNWFEYVAAVKSWPLKARLRFTWYILFDRRKPYRS